MGQRLNGRRRVAVLPERPEDEAIAREAQPDILKRGADDDVSVRAKSSGHKKKTADKWNQ